MQSSLRQLIHTAICRGVVLPWSTVQGLAELHETEWPFSKESTSSNGSSRQKICAGYSKATPARCFLIQDHTQPENPGLGRARPLSGMQKSPSVLR